jgi:hypothetical protein
LEILGKLKPSHLLWGSQDTVKTFFAIALNCAYLTLTVGVAQTTHYCMGRLNNSSLFSFQTYPCACSIIAGKLSSCCDNESILFQIDDDQTSTAPVEVSPVQLPLLEVFDYSSVIFLSENKPIHFFPEKFFRPPPLKAYMMNCSFIFYDEELA